MSCLWVEEWFRAMLLLAASYPKTSSVPSSPQVTSALLFLPWLLVIVCSSPHPTATECHHHRQACLLSEYESVPVLMSLLYLRLSALLLSFERHMSQRRHEFHLLTVSLRCPQVSSEGSANLPWVGKCIAITEGPCFFLRPPMSPQSRGSSLTPGVGVRLIKKYGRLKSAVHPPHSNWTWH